jgi:XTP/dITP diphosphohydrolase
MKIVFASNNEHKLQEIQTQVGDEFEILSLQNIGCYEDIAETGLTLDENAHLKSEYVSVNYGIDCFADDTGLEIEALNQEPGVYSARYSGERNPDRNMDLVLEKMEGIANRRARFRTVISLIWLGEEYKFEGIVNGLIRTEKTGALGFGYDPIFEPEGYHITFAEMDVAEKNNISHRGMAVKKLVSFLQQQVF